MMYRFLASQRIIAAQHCSAAICSAAIRSAAIHSGTLHFSALQRSSASQHRIATSHCSEASDPSAAPRHWKQALWRWGRDMMGTNEVLEAATHLWRWAVSGQIALRWREKNDRQMSALPYTRWGSALIQVDMSWLAGYTYALWDDLCFFFQFFKWKLLGIPCKSWKEHCIEQTYSRLHYVQVHHFFSLLNQDFKCLLLSSRATLSSSTTSTHLNCCTSERLAVKLLVFSATHSDPASSRANWHK